MNNLLILMEATTLFGEMNRSQRIDVANFGSIRSFGRGEFIALHGENWPNLLLVMEGSIDVVKESADGRRLTLISLEPGDIFWGISFFGSGNEQPASFVTRGGCKICTWTTENLLPYLINNGQELWALCQLMVKRMQQASQIVEGLAFQQVATRLARFILDLAGEEEQPSVSRDLTLDEIASLVGSTREVVCRLLYRFANDNLIEITRTEFVLTDTQGLGRLATPG